jgi:hypothetical protein
MIKTLALGILTLLTTVSYAFADEPHFEGVVGAWETDVPENDWHYVKITPAKEGEAGPYRWTNKAGKSWSLATGHIQPPNGGERIYTLTFGDDAAYPGHVLHLLRGSDGKLVFLRQYGKDSDKEVGNWVPRRTRTAKADDRYDGLAGSYNEETGGKMRIRKANADAREAGPWRFVLGNEGDWACAEGQDNPGGGKPTVFYIQFSEGPFEGERYNIIRDKNRKVKELQLVGGRKTIWVRE